MRTDLFDFDLPADRIALRPANPRDAARLLVVGRAGRWIGSPVADLPDLLQPGDCLVVNDTKVIAARLTGRRVGRGAAEPEIEATLHKRLDGSHWRAFILGAKKVQVGDALRFGTEGRSVSSANLMRSFEQKDEGGEITLAFSFQARCSTRPSPSAARCRCRPISPRAARADEQDEPTTRPFSPATKARWRRRPPGCISPPAAGRRLRERGIGLHTVTLHVGAGTFLPVKADDTESHRMHAECGAVSP